MSAVISRERARPSFARAYLTTSRPYLFLVSGATGLVGLSAASTLSAARLVAGTLVFSVAYGLGQALTDVTQMDTDALSAPYRPLVRGELRPRDVVLVSLFGLALCVSVLASMNAVVLVPAALSVVMLATYTPMKRRWWAGPAWNSAIVALLPPMGALLDGRSLLASASDPRVLAASASAFFGYATFVLLGYLKDVEADRTTGYRTLPVVFGRRPTVLVSAACAFAAAAAALVLAAPPSGPSRQAPSLPALVVCALGLVLLAGAHVRAWNVERDEQAHPAIVTGLRGYVLLQLGQACLLRRELVLVAAPLYALFSLALVMRPSRGQV